VVAAPDPNQPGQLTRTAVKTEPGDYRGYYANVRDAILGSSELAVTPEDGYRVIRLLELARQSSDGGRSIPVQFSTI
jgi:predicted dehydrogenase